VHHRRRILFVKPRYWIIVDDLDGPGAHRLELRFQFGPIEVRREDAPWIRARGPSKSGLVLGAFATTALALDVRSGTHDPIEGWTAPVYGARRPAPVAVYSVSSALPVRLVSVLWPSERADGGRPAVSLRAQAPNLELQCGRDVLLIGDETIRCVTPETTHELG